MLSLTDATFDYGRERILAGASVAVHPGQKCALVGANGAGKTTLLALLAGELAPQGGTRQTAGRVEVRFLRQETTLDPATVDRDLISAVADAAFRRERELERELAEVTAELAQASDPARQADLAARHGRLQDEFERRDGYTVQARLEAALRGVGLLPEAWPRPVAQLSGGERRRAALAAVLLSGADLLLLDEPTNHLDLEACEWLEGFLAAFAGAAVIVSHDRHFLDRVTRRTLHLERGRVVNYAGNYTFFDEQRALRYEQELNAWQRQQAKIRQAEEYIRRNIEGQNTKQAQSRRKQLAKEERIERPTSEPGLFRFHLKPARDSGGTVLETHGLGKSWGQRTVLRDCDLHVSRGDRVGILGPNGCGKSTLLKMLAGRVLPDAGRVVTGHNVDLGFYDQELTGVSDHNTVVAEMMSVDPGATLGELRSFLGAFGFGEDLYDREVSRLSGGERGRLSLLRLIKEGHNTLLLDEPTNHLDIRSRESLEAALREYNGTMIVVSHDRRFLEKLVDRLLVFPASGAGPEAAGRVRVFDGSYGDWIYRRDRERAEAAASPAAGTRAPAPASTASSAPAAPGGRSPLSKNEQERRRKWIAEAEEAILQLETEKEDALAAMAAPETDNDRRLDLGRRLGEIETELAGRMADWEQWHLEIEEGIES